MIGYDLFEALKFNREPLEMLISLGGKQDDLRFIDLYTEYEVMKKQGEKDHLCSGVFGK